MKKQVADKEVATIENARKQSDSRFAVPPAVAQQKREREHLAAVETTKGKLAAAEASKTSTGPKVIVRAADAKAAIQTLADLHGFKLDFGEAA